MEKVIMGVFTERDDAEKLIHTLTSDLHVPKQSVSFVYRNGDDVATSTNEVTETLAGAATGAVVGGTAGTLAGIATVMGVIPVIGPIFAAGPIIAALGIGAGAIGTTAAGALTGAMAGGLIGTLAEFGMSESEAQALQDRIKAGDVMVVVRLKDEETVQRAFSEHNASTVSVHTLTEKEAVTV